MNSVTQGAQSQLTVLVAEDNHGDAFIVSRGLAGFRGGCHVHTVSDGEELLQTLGLRDSTHTKHVHPDLILIDLYMPKIYGLQALQEIQQSPRLCSIPCVMMSSFATEDDRWEARRLGACEFIQKPGSLAEFRETIKQIEHILDAPPHRCKLDASRQ